MARSWASSSASVRRLDLPREPFFLCFSDVATEPVELNRVV